TDPQEWNAAFQRGEQWRTEMLFVERPNECGKVTNSGKNKRARLIDLLWRIRARGFRAKFLQRAFDAGHVARTVVDQCDGRLHSKPFVLGSTLRSRLSRETANRRARANALNN